MELNTIVGVGGVNESSVSASKHYICQRHALNIDTETALRAAKWFGSITGVYTTQSLFRTKYISAPQILQKCLQIYLAGSAFHFVHCHCISPLLQTWTAVLAPSRGIPMGIHIASHLADIFCDFLFNLKHVRIPCGVPGFTWSSALPPQHPQSANRYSLARRNVDCLKKDVDLVQGQHFHSGRCTWPVSPVCISTYLPFAFWIRVCWCSHPCSCSRIHMQPHHINQSYQACLHFWYCCGQFYPVQYTLDDFSVDNSTSGCKAGFPTQTLLACIQDQVHLNYCLRSFYSRSSHSLVQSTNCHFKN